MSYDFYSSREERLLTASSGTKRAYEKRKVKGFFKKNPQLKILVIDLILVLLFAVIIIPFFVKLTKDIRVDDYKITPKAIQFENQVLISIKIKKLNKKISNRIATDSLKVDIIENKIIINSENKLLPNDGNTDAYITFKLEDNNNLEFILLHLETGAFSKEYNVKIER